jgi:hypothetical protein
MKPKSTGIMKLAFETIVIRRYEYLNYAFISLRDIFEDKSLCYYYTL